MAQADIVVDYGFGDAGKGATVDFLARQRRPDWNVFFNGGAQRAHNVVAPDGRHHCFHQFGSALLAEPRTKTYIGRGCLFDPFLALQEQKILQTKGVTAQLFVHPEALVVTPWHVAMNQLRETHRAHRRHGSCGMGIGEAKGDYVNGRGGILAGSLKDSNLRTRLQEVIHVQERKAQMLGKRPWETRPNPIVDLLLQKGQSKAVLANMLELYPVLDGSLFEVATEEILADADYIIFEGSQGVLLDEWVGFHPHTTWSDCTPQGAYDIIAQLPHDNRLFGVLRAFGTRHGSGPFPGEDTLTWDWALKGEHNALNPWQGQFRTGWFDLPLARYAIEAAGKPDQLVLTCLDRMRMDGPIQMVSEYVGQPSFHPATDEMSEEEMLLHQKGITLTLQDVYPVFMKFGTPEDLADAVRKALVLPKGWDSWGPTGRKAYKRMRG